MFAVKGGVKTLREATMGYTDECDLKILELALQNSI